MFFLRVFFLLGLLVLGTYNVEARVIDGGEMTEQPMEENLCALTFDDGPSIFTPQLLDMLKEYQIPATFFMLGSMVDNYKDITLRVWTEGHEIASHTYAHKNLKRLSFAGQWQEIERGYESLANLGIVPTYVRPPYGSFDERTRKIADAFGMNIVLWSVDSKDWKRLPDDYSQLTTPYGTPFEEGQMHGVFLFHDIHKRTVDDLPRIIAELRKGGCTRFVTFSEYMAGIADPEPPLLMTRHTNSSNPSILTHNLDFPATGGLEGQGQSSITRASLVSHDQIDAAETKENSDLPTSSVQDLALPQENSPD
ncbi:MAG: polysaccharide deacetylase family protein [Desulfovibrionaceae bacterium]|nr:polysaccharide deacetylase family protein [Desulfovibrionaceae bacterium]